MQCVRYFTRSVTKSGIFKDVHVTMDVLGDKENQISSAP